jgi:cytochrome o ubiquinol oxidase subunit 1
VPVFAQKRLFGYTSMVVATMVIVFLSFVVWLHHFFTMGAGANVNSFFGIMTMVISIPTGVKVFNWLFTMFRGRILFRTPFLWFMGFAIVFAIGGMTGVLLAVPGADFELHNSLFLVAHFHNMVIGGVVFGLFSGMSYWFPKFFGFKLQERFGVYAFWCWVIGFAVAFVPIYIAGLMGMTRRLTSYPGAFGWHPLLVIAFIGVGIIGLGVIFQVIQFILSFKNRETLRDETGDPWNGRTLEWATASPVPVYNFAIIPTVESLDALYEAKQHGGKHGVGSSKASDYEDIYLPKNSAIGMYIAAASFVFGFAMVWHILWIVPIMALIILGLLMYRALDDNTEYCITAAEVARIESTSSHWHI